MSRRRQRPTQQKRRAWQPLERATIGDPAGYAAHGLTPPDRAYRNDLYSVFIREIGHGAQHVSFHRHDRAAVRDWRHYQAIKNEVAGPEALGLEVFPPESRLVDTANEYHLFTIPAELADDFPFLISATRLVQTQAEGEVTLGRSKMRQREWQPGLPTGPGHE